MTVSIDTVRVNIFVPYLLTIYQYVMSACGLTPQLNPEESTMHIRPSTSTATTDAPNELFPMSCNVSARFKQFELALFADPTQVNSIVLVLKVNKVL